MLRVLQDATVTSKSLSNNNMMQFEQNFRKVNNTVIEYDHGDNLTTKTLLFSQSWNIDRNWRQLAAL